MNISKEKIKLIASDLDGTLLNSNKKISEYNQKIIKKLINEYNINFILSSGRPYEGIKNYNKILENNNLSIIFNGASIADNNGKIIFYIDTFWCQNSIRKISISFSTWYKSKPPAQPVVWPSPIRA